MAGIGLFLAQRISAMVMAPLALIHVAVMVYAVHGGLTAAEILSRTQGSLFWFSFYGLFVVAVSVHAAIGVMVIVHEWTGLRGWPLRCLAAGFGGLSLLLGARAVSAVTGLP